MDDFESVIRTPDLGPGAVAAVQAHGRDMLVANLGQTYYAVDATCPVDGTNLGRDGTLEGETLVCPNDQARFDIRTGARVDGAETLAHHAIRVQGNEVFVGPRRVDEDG